MKKLLAILLFTSELTGLYAQEAIPASGSNASGSGGSVNYTVGQIDYKTSTGTNGSAAQGIQQPYEISIVTGIEEANGINLICSAYPNPATEYVKLKVENYKIENLVYQLYDISGKLIKNNKVDGIETFISMENLVPATYFLKVINKNNIVKTFKINKN